jgi:hypothetical protein
LGGVLRRDNGALHYFASVIPNTVTLFESYHPDFKNKAGQDLEAKLSELCPAGCMEIYNSLSSFEYRIRKKIHDIDLMILFIPDVEILAIAENMREEIAGLPLVILVGPKVAKEKKRLYRFFPRIILPAGERSGIIENFVKAKTEPFYVLKSVQK